ncbi:MAG TPA: hypothetical protein VFA10_15675 [Ktedonobacteraceae bacterium]|nr:hypothetical protein [Ktedonobacteraceae bacterium]
MSIQFHPASVGCDILSVNPPEPTEFTPIAITVTVTNSTTDPFSGSVAYAGTANPTSGASSAQVNLPAGSGLAGIVTGQNAPSTTVTVFGLAPAAGQNVAVQVNLFKDEPGVEFPPPIGNASFTLNIAANYQFAVESLHCLNPRSLDNDTLKGSCRVLFGGQPLASCHPQSPFDVPQATQYEEYGDHGAGAVISTSFCFTGFGGVPGLAPDLTITYDFENSGYAGSAEDEMNKILDVVSDLGAGVATALVGGGSGWGLVDQAHHQINAAIFSSCDGPVAGDFITVKSDVLAEVTTANGTYTETRTYPGTSSPAVCGEVSHYEVTFTFTRLSMPH